MNNTQETVKKSKMTSFQRRITYFGSGGPFLDGYVIVIIGIALMQLIPGWNLTAAETGLLGAGTLFGVLFGGLIGGYLTDIIGRRKMYILNVVAMIVLSVVQFFVQDVTQLAICRFLLGLAIGADYPIASTMVTEFSTQKHRSFMVGIMNCIWYVGAVAASLVGYVLLLQFPETGWRWMLLSAVIPGGFLLMGRLGTPESPRWLASKGRKDEALTILNKVFPNMDISEFLAELEKPVVKTEIGRIFIEPVYLKRIIYCGGFYGLMTIPVFAISTFGPQIYEAMGLTGSLWIVAYILSNLFFVIGCIPALWLVEHWGRRPLNIWSFVFMTVGMAILGFFSNAGIGVIIVGFMIFCIAQGGPSVECWMIPNEVFPTELRSSATGISTAISRIGAAVGTYLVPSMLANLGIGNTMLVMAGVCFAGVILCVTLAEETKGKSLAEASAIHCPTTLQNLDDKKSS